MQVPYLTAAVERYERLASYFGVETRHPLLDVRLLRFSNALPLAQKVRDGWSKYMLRSLADKRLPATVAWREGWEEIGWKFNFKLAEALLPDSGLSVATSPSPYPVDHLDRINSSGPPRYDPDLIRSWRDFQFHLWLSRGNLVFPG